MDLSLSFLLFSKIYAIEAHEEIVKLSSPKQMLDAMAAMHKALRIQSQHGQQLAQLLA